MAARRSIFLHCSVLLLAAAIVHASDSEHASPNPAAALSSSPQERIEYNRDVRPILMDACISCHGPDSASRQADLRLDQRDVAVELAAIVPGDPDASEMIRRILSEEEYERMPPPETKKHLTDEQKQTLVRWIQEGAEYQPHWSFIPPARPEPPEVKNEPWIRNPIDRFVLARLEAEGLDPAPEAARHTLARRAALDITGLPPSPEMLAAFLGDQSPGAYERYVDKLLASPRWGEHRGRYWLDAARYGDTHGLHTDSYREMWPYRDWVIKALNANMPFDQFTIENLAGDLLPNGSREQRVASGFNRCNITTNEGGSIDDEYYVLYARDRTETTSQVWLGLTTGCAVCHDHKFDPISQKEFYQLSAFFNNTTQKAMDGGHDPTLPIEVIPSDADLPQWEKLVKQLAESEAAVEARKEVAQAQFDKWLVSADSQQLATMTPSTGLHFYAPLNDDSTSFSYKLDDQTLQAPLQPTVEWRDGKIKPKAAFLSRGTALEVSQAGDFEGDQPFSAAAWVKLAADKPEGAAILARMDDGNELRGWDLWVEGRRIGAHISHKWPGNALKVLTKEQVPAEQWMQVAVVYDGSRKATGLKIFINGRQTPIDVQSDSLSETIRTDVPLKIGQRQTTSPLKDTSIEDVRIYARALSDDEVSSLAIVPLLAKVQAAKDGRDPTDLQEIFAWYLYNRDDVAKSLVAQRDELVRGRNDIAARSAVTHVMQERPEPATAYILNRGEYDQRLDQVSPDTPEILPPFSSEYSRNRLGLARWLMSPDNPLTARVTVNRFWQEIFGQGLVRTAGDFGVAGELPSHPELLDWLAIEFQTSGWDMKQFYKLLVTSATYRQSGETTPEKLERDADNRLLSRGPRFRMDGEMVRDYALATSGLLSPKIGGPSVRPYQPPGVWEAVSMTLSNTREYVQDSGESLYRRSVYSFWKRSAPPASLETFNAPTREHCIVVRERTNTPLQALVTLNDVQFVEAARELAQRAMHDAGPSVDHRLSYIAVRLLARELTSEEQTIAKNSIEKLQSHYASHGEEAKKLIDVGDKPADASLPAPELAAWTMAVNGLLNLDEVLTK